MGLRRGGILEKKLDSQDKAEAGFSPQDNSCKLES